MLAYSNPDLKEKDAHCFLMISIVQPPIISGLAVSSVSAPLAASLDRIPAAMSMSSLVSQLCSFYVAV